MINCINRSSIFLILCLLLASCTSSLNDISIDENSSISDNAKKSILKNILIKFPGYRPNNQGLLEALNLELGIGVRQNFYDAKNIYDVLAKEGNLMAIVKMGEYYELGLGGERNLDLAKMYYLEAANKNYPPAMNNLGLLLHIGPKEIRDLSRAKYWYYKAVEKDDVFSKINLADLFKKLSAYLTRNNDVISFLSESVLRYKIPRSMAIFGQNLKQGWGVDKDIKRGKYLYRKSLYWNNYCGDIRSEAKRFSLLENRLDREKTVYYYRYYTEICSLAASSYIKFYIKAYNN